MSRSPLERLVRRQRRRDLLTGAVAALLLLAPIAIADYRLVLPAWLVVVWAAGVVALCGAWLELRLSCLDDRRIAEHLDRRLESMEDSATLLTQDRDQLTVLQRLQRDRVQERLTMLPLAGLFPWPRRFLWIVLGVASGLGVVAASIETGTPGTHPSTGSFNAALAGDLETARVTIAPPAYTGLAPRDVQSLDVDAEEGADLTWTLRFRTAVADVHLSLDDGSEIHALDPSGRRHQVRLQADRDRIYRLRWRDSSGQRQSDFHRLQMIRDRPPEITVITPERSPEVLEPGDPPESMFQVEVRDDHGVGTARILATVAKGQGEGVKFRDVELPFDRTEATAEGQQMNRRWLLADLGMEPGDELYFRAQVNDNRQPEANRSQTPVLMIRWESEEEEPALSIEGIAVDLLPEYFRSQRQIIIDTEKLIEDAASITRSEGDDRSRSLAFDQKALRIRYGQYLGEEYSTDVAAAQAPSGPMDGEEHRDESYSEHLAHASQDDHGHNEDEHGPVSSTIESLPEFMSNFVHIHDSSEQATLFDEKTRETLKAALSAMWRAELELHLSRPQQALPHEYEALRYLKEVQQANRIYVRRVGFEPPALDEGKRLSGELEEAFGPDLRRAAVHSTSPKIETALQTLLDPAASPSALRAAAVAWRNHLGEEPESLEVRLALTRMLGTGMDEQGCPDCLETIQAAAWGALGVPAAVPGHRPATDLSGRGRRYLERAADE